MGEPKLAQWVSSGVAVGFSGVLPHVGVADNGGTADKPFMKRQTSKRAQLRHLRLPISGVPSPQQQEGEYNMSIMELGALGEFLGSIGVIATLIYLAVQIRANTNSTKAETFQRLTNEVTNWNTTLVLEPKLIEFVLDIANLNPGLTPVEQIRLEAFAMTIFRQWDNVIYQGELGTIDKPRVEGCLFAVPTFLPVSKATCFLR